MASQTQTQRSLIPIIIGLCIIGIIGFYFLSSLNIHTSTTTQNNSEGQCLSSGKNFNARLEAFTLAQTAEQYRSANKFAGNYGLASYTICYKDGSQSRVQSSVFKGFDSATKPKNSTHSEQAAYGWLRYSLPRLSVDQNKVVAIYTVIFSQVVVCNLCQQDMKSWQRILRQQAKTNQLFLSIWDIMSGKGFNPATYPAGTGIPVTIDDVRKVPIDFTS